MKLVRDIRVIEDSLGDGVKKITADEVPIMKKLRRVRIRKPDSQPGRRQEIQRAARSSGVRRRLVAACSRVSVAIGSWRL